MKGVAGRWFPGKTDYLMSFKSVVKKKVHPKEKLRKERSHTGYS